ncbi:ubiquitin carboxyl-terminal hydrolase 14 [Trichosporon asahii var. asahii CBS 8904]|uniref:Ubiquitin carboxyl-terminal hydrolase n=1 Tax=Trichosporon asahii var. asahii (strain CBS 8904) TaxID=1220162 RepID=K1W0J4_TRIAC|nr:ubiquitin carboxyl-terminal hydrolase 14 [Trichosporon asahii var. asahii CBS 8904]
MACSHVEALASSLKPPSPSQQVHREECTLCFDGQCFNGGCFGEDRKHAYLHSQKKNHPLGVVIKRTRKEQKKRDNSEPPMKKLAISAPSDEETYDYSTSVRCFGCSPVGEAVQVDNPAAAVDGIMKALSSAQQSEVKAWEEEIIPCEHALTLEQVPLITPGEVPSQCTECDLTSNLWLCLTCGLANCGRQQYGGIGGNGHALQHFKDTGYNAETELIQDIYCYSCDDAKIDPDLANHLRTFGINVLDQSKTEKSMTELFDFSMTGDDGKELEPMFGKGLTGFKNLGNSCYMASVLQTLFSIPAFHQRYYTEAAMAHPQTCDKLPADCLECQMLKVADGLLSGRYSKLAKAPPPANSEFEVNEEPKFQDGIRPAQFKALIGKGHEEFSTMRQQDSEEFLGHLLSRLRQEAKSQGRPESSEATDALRFGMEQRLQCDECKKVGYKVDSVDLVSLPVEAGETGVTEDGKKTFRPVTLESCIEALCAPEELTDYACGTCGKRVRAETSTKFKTYPELLVLHMKKFQLVNWLPTKLDVPVQAPDSLNLDKFHGTGRQPGEEELDIDAAPAAAPQFDPVAMSQLEAMGFPTVRCQKALLATGGNDAEMATAWLFEHMDDPDIDAPIPTAGGSGSAAEPSQEQITMLSEMGFTPAQARKALRESNGNAEHAVEWLFSHPDDDGEEEAPAAAAGSAPSGEADVGGTPPPANYRLKAFVSHKGPSVHSGHYVATIRQPQKGLADEKEDEWVLFNDEKVVRAPPGGGEEMRSLAYLYVYERV